MNTQEFIHATQKINTFLDKHDKYPPLTSFGLLFIGTAAYFSTLFALEEASSYFSRKIETPEELAEAVAQEKNTLHLTNTDITVLLEEEDYIAHTKKTGEHAYEIHLSISEEKYETLRHELYHVKRLDEMDVYALDLMDFLFLEEPVAAVYAAFRIQL